MFDKFQEYGVIGMALAITWVALQLVMKKFSNGRGLITAPTKGDLTDGLKSAIFATRDAAIQTRDWHRPDAEGFQDWKGGRLLEEQKRTNVKLDKVIDLLAEQLRKH